MGLTIHYDMTTDKITDNEAVAIFEKMYLATVDRTKQMLSRPLSALCQQLFSELEQKYPRYHRFSQLDEVLDIKTKLMTIVDTHTEQ